MNQSISYQILAGTYERNLEIKKLRKQGVSCIEIGRRYGLTRERIRQIVKR